MADQLIPSRRFPIALVVTLLIAAVLIGGFLWSREQQRQREEELAQAQSLVRVLSATFEKQSALKVGEVDGALDVTSIDPGTFDLLRSAQKVTLPYSIDYTVDLSDMTPDQYRWDKESRTLVVEAPNVQVGTPNIDEARRRTIATQGIFVSRRAADNLSRRAAVQANRAAMAEANKPEHFNRARENAREVIAGMLRTPMEVAGLGPVNVVVRFPQDGVRNNERWDVSPSIADVLEQRQK
ncbi:DUF4230 domain-containing protein [Sphingomonas sp. LY160]|uniref:DUF4230 domain-containing protein n=1 Tax=Sphingomonas sp. LY160 TaxID=3095342 RepID=UPI002ADEB9DB|nr:DUF4230 domain-containing protein [Sphingomonas sp. LY160]MEA1073086.1 DUF4230 domain-containing protein [Sphingomonas sp. LY160]